MLSEDFNRERRGLHGRILALVNALSEGTTNTSARDNLLFDMAQFQAKYVAPYRRLIETQSNPQVSGFPPLSTDVFRFLRVAAHPPEADLRVFLTSGTTEAHRGQHALCDLSLYDAAAHTAAKHALFPDVDRMRLVILAPSSTEVPTSSLSYMLNRFVQWFGQPGSEHVWHADKLDHQALFRALDTAYQTQTPVALCGTSFAFVHAEDVWGDQCWELPPGSRIMQTGGFKNRSRQVDSETLRAALSKRYNIDPQMIIAEYGMTELSSQMYENTLRDSVMGLPARPRHLWTPGWVRATIVDPSTLQPQEPGKMGVLRLDDSANLDTACGILTADLARSTDHGFVLLGRASDAPARGCSLSVSTTA